MSDDLPFKAEYAKSSRSTCKDCKETIFQDSLRIAKMVQSSHFDGKMPLWHHFHCFFKNKKFQVPTHTHIANFDNLRWDDQEKIKAKLPDLGTNGDSIDGAVEANCDFSIEYAKSGRAKCRKCESKIEKGVIRIAKMEVPEEKKYGVDLVPRWHHLDCFIDRREELDALQLSPHDIPGFKTISVEDQEEVVKKFGDVEVKKAPVQKKKNNKSARQAAAAKEKDEEILKAQNKKFWKIRDKLFRSCENSVIRKLLEVNNSLTTGGESDILDRCADGMMFGALEVCPECGAGGMKYTTSEGYFCTGNISAWTGCTYKTITPKRKPWKIPKELKEDNDFLANLKLKVSERKFPAATVTMMQKLKENQGVSSEIPLNNKQVVIIGRLKGSQASLKKKIEEMGGEICTSIFPSCFCCVSSPGEVMKGGKKMEKLEEYNIPVVAEEYIDAVKKNGKLEGLLSQYAIAPWGGSIKEESNSKSGSLKRKSEGAGGTAAKKSKVVKMVMKGGAAVDPDSKKESSCHLLRVSNAPLNAVLGLVDLARGSNSYYKLQVLEHDKKKHVFYVFRSWGRVGTTIGGNKLERYDSKEDAVLSFKQLYLEKTGNPWDKRKDFVKQPHLFYPIDIDYGQDDDLAGSVKPGSLTKLSNPVQELIKFIFDVEAMKHALLEYEIDLQKMPLGKLSRKQIEAAYSCLSESHEYVSSGVMGAKVLDVSNRFFTLIPHDFGLRKPPLLDNEELINLKIKMLDSLLEIEIAYSILKGSKENQDPIDVHYNGLNADIHELLHDSEEYKLINDYLANTHAATHSNYKLEIVEVFGVDRKGEKQKFRPFRDLPNRKLLWHGSRSTNYAGILSQGLRIAPPEAPVTGYMFGKGVYFADMSSKSANYCQTSRSKPHGLLLLCDVALGSMYELTDAEHIVKLPPGKHSCKGLGRTCPDPSMEKKLPDGVTVPFGTPIASGVDKTSLLYNEYIVYDTAQVNIKYLVKVKFSYNY